MPRKILMAICSFEIILYIYICFSMLMFTTKFKSPLFCYTIYCKVDIDYHRFVYLNFEFFSCISVCLNINTQKAKMKKTLKKKRNWRKLWVTRSLGNLFGTLLRRLPTFFLKKQHRKKKFARTDCFQFIYFQIPSNSIRIRQSFVTYF